MIEATYRTDERTLLTLHFPAAWDTPAHIEAVARSLAAIHGCPVTFRTEARRPLYSPDLYRRLCSSPAGQDARDSWDHTDGWTA